MADQKDDWRHGRGWWTRASDEVSSWLGRAAARRDNKDGGAHHRGRGPRGYTRSDERIREDVSDRLTENPVLDASDIEVTVAGGEVTLAGSVDSRYSKRLAEDLADDVSGVKHVQNNLRVRQAETQRGSISGTSSGIAEGGDTSDLGNTGR
ncbi:MAG: BON domain-containing protein [Acetobacteraceae bacterium]